MRMRMNVLVVDDNKMDRIVVRAALNRLGIHDVTEAENGSVAEGKMRTALEMGKHFDLAIVDWNMPMNNGLSLLRNIRSSAKLKSCRVIMMTATSEKKIVNEAIIEGVDDFIVKPVLLETLGEKIEKLFP